MSDIDALRAALEIIAAVPKEAPDAIGVTARNIARAALAAEPDAGLRAALGSLTDARYPARSPDGPRTDWQNGWNAAMDAVDALAALDTKP